MIKTKEFSTACALTAAILWIGCSAAVIALPDVMWQMTAQMLHIELPKMIWAMGWGGLFLGLLAWSALAGLAGAILTVLYNRLSRTDE